MTINTEKQALDLLFNKYESLKDLVYVQLPEYTVYRFIKGDSLNVVGLVRYPESKDLLVLFLVNDSFDLDDMPFNDFMRFVDLSTNDVLESKAAIAGRRLEVVKRNPH